MDIGKEKSQLPYHLPANSAEHREDLPAQLRIYRTSNNPQASASTRCVVIIRGCPVGGASRPRPCHHHSNHSPVSYCQPSPIAGCCSDWNHWSTCCSAHPTLHLQWPACARGNARAAGCRRHHRRRVSAIRSRAGSLEPSCAREYVPLSGRGPAVAELCSKRERGEARLRRSSDRSARGRTGRGGRGGRTRCRRGAANGREGKVGTTGSNWYRDAPRSAYKSEEVLISLRDSVNEQPQSRRK